MPLSGLAAVLNTFTKKRVSVLSCLPLHRFTTWVFVSCTPFSPPPPPMGDFYSCILLLAAGFSTERTGKRSMRRGLSSRGAGGRNVRPPSHQNSLHTWQTPSVGRIQFLVVPVISRSPAAPRGFQAKFKTTNKQFQTLSEVSYLTSLASRLTLTFSFQG